jgi:queuine tRNA-ribosyltransferase
VLRTPHGAVETPFFCPVAAAGGVSGVLPAELRQAGVRVLLATTYHLAFRPGPDTLAGLGGLHRTMAWDAPIISDSGGFEVFSLGFGLQAGRSSNQAPRLIRVDEDGATFTSYRDGSRVRLTPESSMATQIALGADIMLALNQPTSALHDADYTAQAMERTQRWATRCLDARQGSDRALYGVVQGGAFEQLRRASATFTGRLPFDGVAIGGSPGTSAAQMHAIIDWTTPHVPPAWPRHLLGIGEPQDLLACVERGIDQFDSGAPTRLGRQGLAYTLDGKLDVTLAQLASDSRPIADDCGCYTCRTGFSRGYIRHLFAARELLGYTLASLHNLYFIERLMQRIRDAIRSDRLASMRDDFLARYLANSAVVELA